MTEMLLALIVLPITAAIGPLLLGWFRERTGWPVATATLLVQTTLALLLTRMILTQGRVSYAVGGFEPPIGIELVADGLSMPFVVLIAGVSLALLGFTRRGGPRSNPFYSLYLLLVAGLTGVCLTGDVFNLYVFLEISGLTAYALVARASGGRAAIAALKYLLLGTVGATLYLLGIGYAYVTTGTLNMADLAVRLPHDSPLVLAAFGLIAVGLAVKMALYPLHSWQPDAYEFAPIAVSSLLSALVSTVAGYALIRLTFGVFTLDLFRTHGSLNEVILVFATGSVLAGGILAYRERAVKRVLAYSSVAQFGLAALGLGLGTVPAVVGAVIQLVGHAVMKGGLFAGAGVLAARTGAVTLDDFAGVGARAPLASGSLTVMGLGMVGIPPTIGFVAKWYLAVGAVQAEAWPILAVIVGSTLLSLTYFGRLIQQVYVVESSDTTGIDSVSHGMRWVTVGAAFATVGLGIGALALASFVEPTVAVLLEQ